VVVTENPLVPVVGAVLTSIFTVPSGALNSSNLALGTASVVVSPGTQTTVTFTDAVPLALTSGFLEICKVAQYGLLDGLNFIFDVAGTPVTSVTVPAGDPPLGSCSPALVEPAGPVAITETIPPYAVLTSVATLPSAGLLLSSDLGAGTASVMVPPGLTTTATFTDGVPAGVFQVTYGANVNQGSTVVYLTNNGASGGNICVNAYTFDSAEEMLSCCSCLVTPNGLASLSATQDLLGNPLTGATPGSIVTELLASTAGPGGCNATSPTPTTLEPGLSAWSTTLHQNSGTYQLTENAFQDGGLSGAELTHLTSFCGFIQSYSGGSNTCPSCH
jgi:hypothetical protein